MLMNDSHPQSRPRPALARVVHVTRLALLDSAKLAWLDMAKLAWLDSAKLALLAVAVATLCTAAHAGPLEATRVTLDNGMHVVLAPDSLATAVDVAVWFPAGSRHEKPAQAGL